MAQYWMLHCLFNDLFSCKKKKTISKWRWSCLTSQGRIPNLPLRSLHCCGCRFVPVCCYCLSDAVFVLTQHFLRVQAGVWGVHAGLVPAVPGHPHWRGELSSYPPLSVRAIVCLAWITPSFIKAAWKLPGISCKTGFSCSYPYLAADLS